MATNANTIANIVVLSPKEPDRRKAPPPKWEQSLKPILVTAIYILTTSGVCLLTLCLSHPIFASEGLINTIAQERVAAAAVVEQAEVNKTEATEAQKLAEQKTENSRWQASLTRKYGRGTIYQPTAGVAHMKTVKYINGLPIKINIVEINTRVNPNLIIKPETAGTKLNSKAVIRTIAAKNNAIVAVNGGYFKPETGVPLGSLMVDGKTLTGPIYNRVGIGITQNETGTSFSTGKVVLDIKLKSPTAPTIKIDNINQPRMMSTYTLVYTKEWGKMSPPAPTYGSVVVVDNGKVINIGTNAAEIPENGFVITGPSAVLNKLWGQRNLELEINYPKVFQGTNHIIGGGPYLIKDNQIYIDVTEQKLGAITGKNPRSAIGYTQGGVLILVTVDGREQSSVGVTLGQLAMLMKNLECENAINFDGGGSSVMYVNGKITNSPPTREGIAISNALTISEFKGI